MTNEKKRIEFIDTAKGICILLIVIGHSGVAVDYPGITAMRTPLYLTLSGLFFKDYGSFINLLKHKTNRIFIPFLFFYVISYIIFYIANAAFPGLIRSDARGITDVFTQIQYFNGPLWFLLAIFWDNLFFGIIHINIKKEWLRAVAVFMSGLAGIVLYKNDILLPCVLDASLVCLPFFYFGYILKRTNILFPNRYDRYNLMFSILLFVMAIAIDLTMHPTMFFHDREIEGNIISIIFLPITSVLGLLFLCKSIKQIPIISYFGRYSIIPLCTHHLIYRPIQLVVMQYIPLGNGGEYIVATATLLICYICIPLCIKYIPYFTAQKDLIPINK